ncbi:MAG: ImcF-related family protein [Marivita sp.]|uniref:ImcF-related family protein n=1 Tax=Marivita sp. TaxID=2003365 RepID=UPI003EF98A07
MKSATALKAALGIFAGVTVMQLAYLALRMQSGALFSWPYLIWLGTVLLLVVIVGIVTFIFRKRIWVHEPAAVELRALRQAAAKQFRQARTRARIIDRNPMRVPWYLFLAMEKETRSTVMAELGYVAFGDPLVHKGLTFTTWTSPTALAYRIEVAPDTDLSFDVLNMVLRHLMKNRPSLAINGAFVEYELAGLMRTAATETGNASNINRLLNVASYQFGIDVPVHVALVGLEHLPDLARAAILTDHLGSGVIFGGFLSPEEPTLAARVDRLFQELTKSLNAAQFSALQKQLAPDFCASLLNAPLQLTLLKTQLIDRMTGLAQPLPPRRTPLNLQSIVFVGARAGMSAVDPLSQVAGQRFFSAAPMVIKLDASPDSVTTENAGLLATAYHKESFLAEPNRRYAVQSRVSGTLWSLALVGIVGGFSLAVWENYRAYEVVNARLNQAFDAFYSNVGSITTDGDFLVERVLMLQPIRSSLDDYDALNVQHYRPFLPKWSMQDLYEELYKEELTQGLQATLVDFVEKETFAFNALADGVQLIRLASVEAQLHTDQVRYKDELLSYYASGLAEQGEVSGVFQDQLRATLEDLFEINRPPEQRNESLRTVVAKTLAGLDTADLLYASLMRRSAYAERIDLRQLIGPRFFEVFVPIDDPQIYLVPRGYTRAGFDALFEDGNMPELSEMLNSYEQVIGALDNATENAILRRVAQSYTADYIASWNAFMSALKLRDAESWGDAQVLMQALTNPSENPMDRLANALSDNTDLKVFLQVPKSETPTSEATDAPPNLAPASASVEAATAFNIRSAFRPYLDALRSDGDQKSQFDLFLTYARDVTLWLDEAATAANGAGQFLFERFQNAESANPLAVLNAFVIRSELEIIRNFGRSIADTLDDSAMQFVYEFIDGQWQRQIMSPHGASLTLTFPFDAFSDVDFPLTEFADLFAPEGKLATFETTYLSRFKTDDGVFLPQSTFLLTGNADLTQDAKSALRRIGQITEAMFTEDKPFLEFSVRTGFMSNTLSQLTIASGTTLHQFRHGPVFWDRQTWPVVGLQDNDLTLRFFARSRAVFNEKYVGPWSWFRLVQDGSVSLNPSLGLAEASFAAGPGAVNLQFDAAVRFNPFAPGFFSDVPIPERLFTSIAEVTE